MQMIPRVSFPILLGFLWIATVLIVNPIGEFPLNDDWAFARGVYNLVEKGQLILGEWPAITLVAQLYWGALFCKLFGLSLTVLRISTLVSSLLGVLAFYGITRQITSNKEVSLIAGLLLFFNPLYFSLSFTFMTDVHFLCTFLLAFLFLAKNVEHPSLSYWLLGTLFSIITTLVRQPGLLVPFVFMLIGWIQNRRTIASIIKPVIPFVLTMAAYVLYMKWLEVGTDNPQAVRGIGDLIQGLFQNDLNYYFYRTISVLLYIGFFLLPFLVAFSRKVRIQIDRSAILRAGLVLGSLVILYIGSVFFPIGNIFYNFGLGPKLLKDTYWGGNITPQLSEQLWRGFKYPAILGTVIFLCLFPWKIKSLQKTLLGGALQAQRLTRLGILLVVLAFAGFLSISPYFFDRYTLPLIAFSILLILPFKGDFSRPYRRVGYALLAIYALFSIIGTHHYMSWNRTRWHALNYLMEENNIAPTHIDGGFEFNAWLETGPFNGEDPHGKSWWFITEDDYVVSFGRIHDFEVREVFPVDAVWPFNRDSIFVLWHMVEGLTTYDDYPIRCGAEELAPDPLYFISNLPQIKFQHDATQSTAKAHNGKFSMELSEGKEFGFSTMLKDVRPNDEITIRVWRWDESSSAGLVLSNYEGKSFYKFETTNVINKERNWEQLELKTRIPVNPGFDKVGVYVWNPLKMTVWFDDIEIVREPGNKFNNTTPGTSE